MARLVSLYFSLVSFQVFVSPRRLLCHVCLPFNTLASSSEYQRKKREMSVTQNVAFTREIKLEPTAPPFPSAPPLPHAFVTIESLPYFQPRQGRPIRSEQQQQIQRPKTKAKKKQVKGQLSKLALFLAVSTCFFCPGPSWFFSIPAWILASIKCRNSSNKASNDRHLLSIFCSLFALIVGLILLTVFIFWLFAL